jgi:hypothetical protein
VKQLSFIELFEWNRQGMTDRPDGAPPPGLNDLYFCTAENGRLVSTPPESQDDEEEAQTDQDSDASGSAGAAGAEDEDEEAVR